MRKFKASGQARVNYVYFTADNKKIVLTPDEVDESWISILHEMDDKEVDDQRRNDYHTPVHYEAYSQNTEEDTDDRNPYLSDEMADPLGQILQEIEADEYEDQMVNLIEATKDLKPEQKDLIEKKFYLRKTNMEIALEEGVSETAIRKRLKTIYKILEEKI